MKIIKRLSALLLAVLMLLSVPALAVGADGEEDDGEPIYIVQLHSSITALIPSLGNNLKMKIGETYSLPQEGVLLFGSTRMVYPGHTLMGYAAYVWGGSEQLFYKEGSETPVPLDEATFYSAPAALVEEDPVKYKSVFTLREGMLNETGLGLRADIWAVWSRDSHTVTFTLADGTALPSATAMTSQVITLPEVPEGAERDGYDFMWSWGGKNYGPGQEYTLPGYEDKEKVVAFEAKYVPKQYQFNLTYVTFDENGGSEKVSSVSYSGLPDSDTGTVSYTWGTALADVLGTPAAREGFTFGGWFRDEACTAPLTDADIGAAAYQSAYAKWTPIPGYRFKIRFEGMEVMELAYGASLTIPEVPEALRAAHVGYSFGGWSTGNMLYTPGQTVRVSSNLTLTASWDKVYHTLTVKETAGSSTTSHIEGEQIGIGIRKKAGYRFIGWYSEAGELISTDGNFTMPGNDLTLEARFEQEAYLVRLDQNGKVEEIRVKLGESLQLPEIAKRTGYTVLGWYLNGTRVSDSFTPTSDCTLTAEYEEITYTVTYRNNLNSETETETVKYSEREQYTLREPTVPSGYRFAGYVTESGAYVGGDTLTVDGDLTLTAQFEALTVTVKWVNPATGKTETATVPMNGAMTLPEAPEAPKGYRFIGWYNENGEKIEEGTAVSAGTVLTARFEATDGKSGNTKYLRFGAICLAVVGVISFVCFLVLRTPTKKPVTGKSAAKNGKHSDATGKRAGTNGRKAGK